MQKTRVLAFSQDDSAPNRIRLDDMVWRLVEKLENQVVYFEPDLDACEDDGYAVNLDPTTIEGDMYLYELVG